jgi:YgiT-type zinc finger domain-containing protein
MTMTPDTPENAPPRMACPRCGGDTREETVKTAIWRAERLFVVEDILARVCGSCMEQFYDEETTDALRRLTEDGFSSIAPVREIVVPIFSLDGRIARPASSEEEMPVDY